MMNITLILLNNPAFLLNYSWVNSYGKKFRANLCSMAIYDQMADLIYSNYYVITSNDYPE